MNLISATLCLVISNPENGAHVAGYPRVEGSLNQEWRIVEQACHHYT